MTAITCARSGCRHPQTEHSGLAGCLSPDNEGTGYCACRKFMRPDGTTEAVAFPTPGGATFVQEIDGVRLNRQQAAVYSVMADGRFRTLREIADLTGFPEASVSARLRDYRKPPLNRDVQRRRKRTGYGKGTWEYAVLDPQA